jgi:hypothetical protein
MIITAGRQEEQTLLVRAVDDVLGTHSLLLGQQGVVPLGELVVELIAPVGDQGSEVRAVRQLEGQHRRGMAGSQALQLGHRPTLPMVR